MRILKVIDAWKWFAEAENMFQASRALRASGMDVEVACQPESPVAEAALAEGIPVHALPGLRTKVNVFAMASNVRRLRHLIEVRQPAVVHAYRSPPHVLCALALRRSRHPAALVRSRAGAQPVKATRFNRWLYDQATARIIVSAESIARDMANHGFGARRIEIIRGALNPQAIAAADGAAFRARHGIESQTFLCVVVGRLTPIKGQREAVRAFGRFLARGGEGQLALVGPAAEDSLDDLRAFVAREGLTGRVLVTGPEFPASSAMAAADLGLIASLGSEVISRVLFELWALRRPVLATTVGVIPELVRHDQDGWLVAPGDVDAMAEALLQLYRAPERRAALGAAGLERVRSAFSEEALAAQLVDLYRALV